MFEVDRRSPTADSEPPREQITELNSKDRIAPIRAVEKTTTNKVKALFLTPSAV